MTSTQLFMCIYIYKHIYICIYVYVYICVYTCDVYTWWALRRCWLLLWLTGALWSLNERIHKLYTLWVVYIWTAIIIFPGLLRSANLMLLLPLRTVTRVHVSQRINGRKEWPELFSLQRPPDGWNQIGRSSPSWCRGRGSPSKHPPLCTFALPPLWQVTKASPAQKPGQRE